MITLQFSTERDALSRMVRLATWSEFSHVDFVLPDGRLLGALPSGGVAVRKPSSHISAAQLQVDASDAVLAAAMSQRGKPYDWGAIAGFATHRDWQRDDRWFCSELVAWAFHEAGTPLLRTDHLSRITPRDLLLSPLLQPL